MEGTVAPETEQILDLLQEKASVPGQVTPTTTFEDLDLDSLVLVELAVILSKRYDVPLDEGELADAGHAEGVVALLRTKLGR